MTDWRKLLVDEQLWDYRCKAVPDSANYPGFCRMQNMKSDLEQERDSLVELSVNIIKARERLITYETNYLVYDKTKHGHLQFDLAEAIEAIRRYLIRYGHKALLKGNY